MKLTVEELKKITTGYVYTVTDEEGYLRFRRFSPKAEEFYKATNKESYRRTVPASSVRMEFKTDATALTFAYRTEPLSALPFNHFDVWVDGVLLYHPGAKDKEAHKEVATLSLGKGNHHVIVYFPCLSPSGVKDVELVDATFCTPVERKLKMLAFGDSITQGYNAEYPSQTYINLVADKLNATVINQAIGGEEFHPEIINTDLPFTPDVITVAYGTNDWSHRDRESATRDAFAFYKTLRETFPKAKIFAITPLWRLDSDKEVKFGAPFEAGIQLVRDAASAQENVVVVDGMLLVPHMPEFYQDLRLHPSDFGFRFYADGLYDAMLPHVKELV